MADRQSLTIDVVSDVVCPWCYLGQKRLDSAIAAAPDVDVVGDLAAVPARSYDPA